MAEPIIFTELQTCMRSKELCLFTSSHQYLLVLYAAVLIASVPNKSEKFYNLIVKIKFIKITVISKWN